MALLHRIGLAAAAVAAAVTVAACGGTGPGGGGRLPEGAELLPAETPVLVSIATDFDGEQWQAVERLAARFPAGAEAIESLLSDLTGEGLDFEEDVRPALGDEVNVALLDLPAEGEPTVAMVLRPDDPAALEELLETDGGDPPVWRDVDGWYVVAETEADIDRALADGESLADSERFATSLESLPGDALVRLYVDGPAIVEGLGEAFEASGQQTPNPFDLLGVGTLESVGMALAAEDGGVRLDGIARSEDTPAPEATSSALAERVPADALVYVATAGVDESISELLDMAAAQQPDFDQALAQIELALGVSLTEDVLPIFAGDTAFYVRAGAPIPEVTVLLSPDDPARALATLDKLVAGLASFAALSGSGSDVPAATDTTVAGIPAKQLQLGDVTLLYGLVGEQLVLTTAVKGIADLATEGPRLADDQGFQEALEASGAPDETSAIAYVDVAGAIDVLDAVGAFDEASDGVLANLRPLRHLVIHASGEEGEARFSGFLAIE